MILFSVVINSFVHVIMYSYYFAALFGPAVQQKLEGIKKNITLIQMVRSLVCSVDFWFPKFVGRFRVRKSEKALKFYLVRISDDNDQNFVFYYFRSNLPLFCYNVHYQWRVAVMYPSYWLPFMCQILFLYFICFTDSLRMLITKKAFRRRLINIQNPESKSAPTICVLAQYAINAFIIQLYKISSTTKHTVDHR